MKAEVVDSKSIGYECNLQLDIYIYIYMGIHALCIPIKPCNQHPNWNNCANLQPRHPNKVKFTIYVTCTFQTQRFSCAWLGELKVQLGHPIKVCGGDE